MNQKITIIKRDAAGREVIRYGGKVLRREVNALVLEATFDHADLMIAGTLLRRGDRFIETYFMDRWYNIFEIRDHQGDALKGWYCNIGKPAVWEPGNGISYVDLALDLWVAPDGTQMILDQAEFEALHLDQETHRQALAAMVELQSLFSSKKVPGLF